VRNKGRKENKRRKVPSDKIGFGVESASLRTLVLGLPAKTENKIQYKI
jgi:hypothetical protein